MQSIGKVLSYLYNENIIIIKLAVESFYVDKDQNVILGDFSTALRVSWKYKNHIVPNLIPSQYFSPEVLLAQPDQYISLNKHPTFSFGILLHILCVDQHPLKDYDSYQIHKTLFLQQILDSYPVKFQDYAKSLITRKPEQRLALQQAIDGIQCFIVYNYNILLDHLYLYKKVHLIGI